MKMRAYRWSKQVIERGRMRAKTRQADKQLDTDRQTGNELVSESERERWVEI